MDLAGLHALLHMPVVVTVALGTKFIGRLETIPNSATTVTLVPLDVGSIVFVQRLAA
jgi:hypothetical protein